MLGFYALNQKALSRGHRFHTKLKRFIFKRLSECSCLQSLIENLKFYFQFQFAVCKLPSFSLEYNGKHNTSQLKDATRWHIYQRAVA